MFVFFSKALEEITYACLRQTLRDRRDREGPC